MDADEIHQYIQVMLAKSPINNAEEWLLYDHEGFGSLELHNESIEKIASLANFIDTHKELRLALLEVYNAETASLLLKENYIVSYDSKVDFAYCIIEECYARTFVILF